MSESAAPARAARICPHLRSDALRQINDDRIDWQLGLAVDRCSPSERVAVGLWARSVTDPSLPGDVRRGREDAVKPIIAKQM
jgi:hypothetical protein